MARPDRKSAKARGQVGKKGENLAPFRENPSADGNFLTTDQGVRVPHTDDSLKAGPRGPTLLEDFHLREKIMRFDHERIPERVVHARGSGAHGSFQVYESLERWTKAQFLCDSSIRTPVFVRFSTVVGSRGSADTVRDVRGFATKFYTQEGNFDLVGNNIPVFFIQDGIKFPDLVHAVKPEPASEMPQAQSAHDTFWDFVSLVPESAHVVMWLMSDRAIPRSYAMMEGFGVHTFRLVNARGNSVFAKFHWKPLLGTHSLVWDEAQQLAGRDPDFHRRDLWESIERGLYPEFELGLQIIPEDEVDELGIDLLDPTKIVPEEMIPVTRVGKLVLDRNPQNFFAETEQVAFCIGNLVPGIDVTDDPLLQARLFSYLDTQLTRLGGPNFAEIPINRPVAPVLNNQQDGFMRTTINVREALYHPNSIDEDRPRLAPSERKGGFVHYPERVAGPKGRIRPPSFSDHYGQATMFFRSLSTVERQHLIEACQFELGKVKRKEIRARVLEMFARIDPELASAVAPGIGVPVPRVRKGKTSPLAEVRSPALSMEKTVKAPRGRRVAVLATHGVDGRELSKTVDALEGAGVIVEVVAPDLSPIEATDGDPIVPGKSLLNSRSVMFDAVYVPGGAKSAKALLTEPDALFFVKEAFIHSKPIGAVGDGVLVLEVAGLGERVELAAVKSNGVSVDSGVVTTRGTNGVKAFAREFLAAIAQHRHWDRVEERKKAAA